MPMDFEEDYEYFVEQKEHDDSWVKKIPIKAIVIFAVAVLLICVVFLKLTPIQQGIIVGIIVLTVIILAILSGKGGGLNYLGQGEATKIAIDYIEQAKKIIPSFKGYVISPTGVGELWEWDFGEGLKPWRWCIPFDKFVDGIRTARFNIFIDPYNGKIRGTALLDTVYRGIERPFTKMIYPLRERAVAQFSEAVKQGRTKW